MNRRTIFLAAAVLPAILVAAGSVYVGWELNRPFAGWTAGSGPSCVIDFPPGSSADGMIRTLADRGVVRHPSLLRVWLRFGGDPGGLQSGEYSFEGPSTPLEVLKKLETGQVLLHSVTLPEGLSDREIALRLSREGFGSEDRFLEAMKDCSILGDLDPAANDLEGYLFPDTYLFSRYEGEEKILAVMVDRFREAAGPAFRKKAEGLGLTLREAVTLASLIEKETSLPEERRKISSVFHNRLRKGMKLQCDPTVIYALRREGHPAGRLTYKDLEFDSPWNTYRYAGLPPGPICNPGEASLLAAVDPEEGRELYFVASPDGGHRFSTTLDEHTRAVRDYRAWIRSPR